MGCGAGGCPPVCGTTNVRAPPPPRSCQAWVAEVCSRQALRTPHSSQGRRFMVAPPDGIDWGPIAMALPARRAGGRTQSW
ncbi:hypothetical protein CJU73_02235 [Pseudomonas fragi]|nr:hypothetical protein CJU73_02235 [Pseudomonas fragi]